MEIELYCYSYTKTNVVILVLCFIGLEIFMCLTSVGMPHMFSQCPPTLIITSEAIPRESFMNEIFVQETNAFTNLIEC